MTVIAPRSSTTARVSRKTRTSTGSLRPATASTASANAMSVAIGIPQPVGSPAGAVALMPKNSNAGMIMPPSAATGTNAVDRVRSDPRTNSYFSSSPATKKTARRRLPPSRQGEVEMQCSGANL